MGYSLGTNQAELGNICKASGLELIRWQHLLIDLCGLQWATTHAIRGSLSIYGSKKWSVCSLLALWNWLASTIVTCFLVKTWIDSSTVSTWLQGTPSWTHFYPSLARRSAMPKPGTWAVQTRLLQRPPWHALTLGWKLRFGMWCTS